MIVEWMIDSEVEKEMRLERERPPVKIGPDRKSKSVGLWNGEMRKNNSGDL